MKGGSTKGFLFALHIGFFFWDWQRGHDLVQQHGHAESRQRVAFPRIDGHKFSEL